MSTGILFDLDGTLLNTLQDITDASNYILARYGCPTRSLDEMRHFVGNGARHQMRLCLPGKENDPNLDDVLNDYKVYYDSHCQIKTRPYEGIIRALDRLGRNHPLGIVSNKPDSTVRQLCSLYFPGIYALGQRDGFPRKPAPQMVRHAMKELGADTYIYVGDSEVDVKTAENAGLVCLSVLWGFRDQAELKQAGAEHYCEKPEDLADEIEKLCFMLTSGGGVTNGK